jgi:hypothetical protein
VLTQIYFSYIATVDFISGRNWIIHRRLPIWCKPLTHSIVIEYTWTRSFSDHGVTGKVVSIFWFMTSRIQIHSSLLNFYFRT